MNKKITLLSIMFVYGCGGGSNSETPENPPISYNPCVEVEYEGNKYPMIEETIGLETRRGFYVGEDFILHNQCDSDKDGLIDWARTITVGSTNGFIWFEFGEFADLGDEPNYKTENLHRWHIGSEIPETGNIPEFRHYSKGSNSKQFNPATGVLSHEHWRKPFHTGYTSDYLKTKFWEIDLCRYGYYGNHNDYSMLNGECYDPVYTEYQLDLRYGISTPQ